MEYSVQARFSEGERRMLNELISYALAATRSSVPEEMCDPIMRHHITLARMLRDLRASRNVLFSNFNPNVLGVLTELILHREECSSLLRGYSKARIRRLYIRIRVIQDQVSNVPGGIMSRILRRLAKNCEYRLMRWMIRQWCMEN